MKKVLFALAATASAFGLTAAANAATVNLSGVLVASGNVQGSTVDQTAIAGSLAVGDVVLSNVDNSALNANNLISNQVDSTQDADGLISGNGSLVALANSNLSLAAVDQTSLAAHLGGTIDRSNVSNAATNINNAALSTTVVVQY